MAACRLDIKASGPWNFVKVVEIVSGAGKLRPIRPISDPSNGAQDRRRAQDLHGACIRVRRDRLITRFGIHPATSRTSRTYLSLLYQAARLLFMSISNRARLATAPTCLCENQDSAEGARKAEYTQAWKQVHSACLEEDGPQHHRARWGAPDAHQEPEWENHRGGSCTYRGVSSRGRSSAFPLARVSRAWEPGPPLSTLCHQ